MGPDDVVFFYRDDKFGTPNPSSHALTSSATALMITIWLGRGKLHKRWCGGIDWLPWLRRFWQDGFLVLLPTLPTPFYSHSSPLWWHSSPWVRPLHGGGVANGFIARPPTNGGIWTCLWGNFKSSAGWKFDSNPSSSVVQTKIPSSSLLVYQGPWRHLVLWGCFIGPVVLAIGLAV